MIRADITTAALREQLEQRIRIVAPLLAAYRIRAQVRPWDGTRCDLLVTDLSDAYGWRAYETAKKRGTRVLAFGGLNDDLGPEVFIADESSPPPVLANALRDLLSGPDEATPVDNAPTGSKEIVGDPQSTLCRLTSPEFIGRAVDARRDGRIVRLRPGRGRIFAPTLDDLLAALDSFSEPGWELRVADPQDAAHRQDGSNYSLEAFLLKSAFNARTQLPAFPQGRYRMKDWPDAGSAPELVDALKVAKVLLRGPANAGELQTACLIGAQDVNACLWAYRAADLLESVDEPAQSSTPPPQSVGIFTGVLARIASKFGLGKK